MEGKRQKQEVEIWQHEASMLFLLVLRCRVEGNYVQELKRLLEGKDSHLPIPGDPVPPLFGLCVQSSELTPTGPTVSDRAFVLLQSILPGSR